ncbi:hypothetical protein GmHk_02G003825 [Glycine max]|nr:hypothetical protein GmHk_02G003825 [Glycine max]
MILTPVFMLSRDQLETKGDPSLLPRITVTKGKGSNCGGKGFQAEMNSRKHRAVPTPGEASSWDSSRFTSEIAWHRYQDNVQLRNILPERNVELAPGMFDEFLQELQRCCWDQVLTRLPEKRIDVTLVKEFYSNLYDPEDRSPKFCWIRGQVVRFDAETINDFLDTPVILADGEEYPAYSQARLIYGLAMKMDLDLDNLISLQIAHLVINLAYIRKNCWNPADPSITFPGVRRARTRAPTSASEAPLPPQPPSQPSSQAFLPPLTSTSTPLDMH